MRTRLSGAPGSHDDEPVALELLDEATEVAGVEVEPLAQGAQVGPVAADLPQHPRRAERPPRARYSSFSAPMRWVTLRLNERTCRVAASSMLRPWSARSISLTLVRDPSECHHPARP